MCYFQTPGRLQVLLTPTVGATYKIADFVVGGWGDSVSGLSTPKRMSGAALQAMESRK